MSAKLGPELAKRFTHACYQGGQMIYRDQATRLKILQDLDGFLRDASQP